MAPQTLPPASMETRLLIECLPSLFAHGDESMIRTLGRSKYVNLCKEGRLGWQDGVMRGEDGTSRIYKCSMTHNRHLCVALYLEGEYEQLVLEAHWTTKSTVRNANKRFGFSCIHCGEAFTDKNVVSYHRMLNQCKKWKGPGQLQMYPTWLSSDNSELRRIGAKFGKEMAPRDSVVQLRPPAGHVACKRKSSVAFGATGTEPDRKSLHELGFHVAARTAVQQRIAWWRPSRKEAEDCAWKKQTPSQPNIAVHWGLLWNGYRNMDCTSSFLSCRKNGCPRLYC